MPGRAARLANVEKPGFRREPLTMMAKGRILLQPVACFPDERPILGNLHRPENFACGAENVADVGVTGKLSDKRRWLA